MCIITDLSFHRPARLSVDSCIHEKVEGTSLSRRAGPETGYYSEPWRPVEGGDKSKKPMLDEHSTYGIVKLTSLR